MCSSLQLMIVLICGCGARVLVENILSFAILALRTARRPIVPYRQLERRSLRTVTVNPPPTRHRPIPLRSPLPHLAPRPEIGPLQPNVQVGEHPPVRRSVVTVSQCARGSGAELRHAGRELPSGVAEGVRAVGAIAQREESKSSVCEGWPTCFGWWTSARRLPWCSRQVSGIVVVRVVPVVGPGTRS